MRMVCTLDCVLRFKLFVVAVTIALGGALLGPVANAGAVGNLSTVHVKLTPVVSGLTQPLALAWRTGDSDMYVAEQRGRVQRVSGGHVAATALTIKVLDSGEQGLLGLTFSPNGTKAYVDYIDKQGSTEIEEMAVSGAPKILKRTRRLLLTQKQPFANHKGGELDVRPGRAALRQLR